jgi:hypothetical protein
MTAENFRMRSRTAVLAALSGMMTAVCYFIMSATSSDQDSSFFDLESGSLMVWISRIFIFSLANSD